MNNAKLFYWRGVNQRGQNQKGSIIATSVSDAQHKLMTRGFHKVKLQRNWQLSTKPKSKEICGLLSQLTMLLQSAVPLKNSLHILQKNCAQIALNQWLGKLIENIEAGLSFSQAIETQGKYLNTQEIQLIRVGEMTGKLPTVCGQIAASRQNWLELQRKLQKIMLYPALVLGISLTLTFLLLLFIVPQFAQMYQPNAADLPTLTFILLTLSEFIQRFFWLVIFATIAAFWLLRHQLRHSLWLNRQKQRLIMLMPVWGGIAQISRLVTFTQSLAIMLQSGIPLNQALTSFLPRRQSWQSTQIQGDVLLEQEVQTILQWVSQGYPLAESVSSDLFPMEAQQMLQIGEKSGKLALMLQNIATNYQAQLDHQIDLLSQLLEPLLMVIIGGLIGIIMLGMYLPIFNMGTVVQ